MNLRDFYVMFHIGQHSRIKNKIYAYQRSKWVAIFHLKKNSVLGSSKYVDFYEYSLVKFKPQIGEKESMYGSVDNTKEGIISLQNEYMETLQQQHIILPTYLQQEVDIYLQSINFTQNAIRDNDITID